MDAVPFIESACDVAEISVADIRVSPARKNRSLDPEDQVDQDFIDSIRHVGVRDAVVIRETTNGPAKYELVFGQRQLAASKHLGFETIPAQVVEITNEQMNFLAAFSENASRRETNYPEYLKNLKMLLRERERLFGPVPGDRQVHALMDEMVPVIEPDQGRMQKFRQAHLNRKDGDAHSGPS